MVHIAFIRLHGISEMSIEENQADEEGNGYFNFFPDHVMSELMIGLALISMATVVSGAVNFSGCSS